MKGLGATDWDSSSTYLLTYLLTYQYYAPFKGSTGCACRSRSAISQIPKARSQKVDPCRAASSMSNVFSTRWTLHYTTEHSKMSRAPHVSSFVHLVSSYVDETDIKELWKPCVALCRISSYTLHVFSSFFCTTCRLRPI